MTEDETERLRTLIADVVGAEFAAHTKHIDERLAEQQRTLGEVQVDVTLALDKLDSIEIDVKDVKTHAAKVTREHIRDRLRSDSLEKRFAEFERRLAALEKAGPSRDLPVRGGFTRGELAARQTAGPARCARVGALALP